MNWRDIINSLGDSPDPDVIRTNFMHNFGLNITDVVGNDLVREPSGPKETQPSGPNVQRNKGHAEILEALERGTRDTIMALEEKKKYLVQDGKNFGYMSSPDSQEVTSVVTTLVEPGSGTTKHKDDDIVSSCAPDEEPTVLLDSDEDYTHSWSKESEESDSEEEFSLPKRFPYRTSFWKDPGIELTVTDWYNSHVRPYENEAGLDWQKVAKGLREMYEFAIRHKVFSSTHPVYQSWLNHAGNDIVSPKYGFGITGHHWGQARSGTIHLDLDHSVMRIQHYVDLLKPRCYDCVFKDRPGVRKLYQGGSRGNLKEQDNNVENSRAGNENVGGHGRVRCRKRRQQKKHKSFNSTDAQDSTTAQDLPKLSAFHNSGGSVANRAKYLDKQMQIMYLAMGLIDRPSWAKD